MENSKHYAATLNKMPKRELDIGVNIKTVLIFIYKLVSQTACQ